ncbi:MAG: hypothetical protein JOZ19_03665 [Rubrobacter sp.]|nr:hypothetical protein [Rubrobacter sp.]
MTTTAYRHALAEVGLVDAINKVLREVGADDPASAETASARVATLLEDLSLPASRPG